LVAARPLCVLCVSGEFFLSYFHGTIPNPPSYIDASAERTAKAPGSKGIGYGKMKEATDVLKIVGIVLLALFVLAVGVPVVLAAAGVALGVLGLLVGLAIALIKIAIVVAIIYLIVVGIRAVLR
jgi:hypothetical protein